MKLKLFFVLFLFSSSFLLASPKYQPSKKNYDEVKDFSEKKFFDVIYKVHNGQELVKDSFEWEIYTAFIYYNKYIFSNKDETYGDITDNFFGFLAMFSVPWHHSDLNWDQFISKQ